MDTLFGGLAFSNQSELFKSSKSSDLLEKATSLKQTLL